VRLFESKNPPNMDSMYNYSLEIDVQGGADTRIYPEID
jgi:hypothetical protein